jgi:hypothetical protein
VLAQAQETISVSPRRIGEADVGIRTRDLLLTMQVLYLLSYVGTDPESYSPAAADRTVLRGILDSTARALTFAG